MFVNIDMRTYCLFVCVFAIANAGIAHAGESERVQFEQEFRLANGRLQSLLGTVKGEGKLESTAKDRTIVYQVEFAVDGESRKVSLDALTQFVTSPSGSSVESKRESQRVFCVAPDVAFSLNRKSADQPYTLSEFGDDAPADSVDIYLDRYLVAPYGIFGIPISKLMADPSFKLLSVESMQEGEEKLLKVSFDYNPKTIGLRSGWFMVSPRSGWAIVKSECQMGDKRENRLACTVEYGETIGEVPFPKRVQYTLPGSRRSEFKFSKIASERSAAKDFTLAAHGLPNLGRSGVSTATSLTQYWLFLLAFLSLLVAVALRGWATRAGRI